jgi:hypothetical protein
MDALACGHMIVGMSWEYLSLLLCWSPYYDVDKNKENEEIVVDSI